MTNRFNDPWNRAIDGQDCPQDGIQRDDLERLLMPNAHDYIVPFPRQEELHVIADCKDQEVLIERGKESVIVKASEINALIAKLVKAKDIFQERNCNGR
ncbi:MAG: hypothetical protein BWY21_00341 [Parcubacteria group bacterium ADurb.Bin216]|nr:MAG: hypothetical protein BWY21_00341 [Parcubacteria group bacterium ADurb.Bin216]